MKKIFLFLSVILLSSLKAMAAEPYALLSDNDTKLTFYYGTKPTNGMSVGPFNDAHDGRWWHNQAADITTVEFHASMANCNTITSTAYWFYDLENLTTVTGIDNLKTANVTNMSYMFYDCKSLTILILSGFDTGKVTNMKRMFKGCTSLTTLDVSKFNTGNVTDMSEMFLQCSRLTSLDVSGFDTGKVTDMNGMFRICSSLTSLDVSRFNTGSVTDMSTMFSSCSSLTSLDVSGFDTGSVTNMDCMFYLCSYLTCLDVSGFDTGNVKNMATMFRGCSSLTGLDVSGFDTGKVTDMSYMFLGCSSLTSLDVSGFDTGKVTNMRDMFYNCSSLKTIYCFDTWDSSTSSQDMFLGCTSLVGGDGTHYSADHVTAAYAHPNVGGYFTKKPLPYALLSDNNTKLTFYYGSMPANGMSVGPFESYTERGWDGCKTSITRVVFDESMTNCHSITSTANWFNGLSNLVDITHLEYLNTEKVKSLVDMFYGCHCLKSIDVSHFDISKVTDMSWMFAYCLDLKTIYCDISWTSVPISIEMFLSSGSIVGGDGTTYTTGHYDGTYAHPYAGGYFTKAEPYALLSGSNNNKTLTFYYGAMPDNGMSVGPFNFSDGYPQGCEWRRECENITAVVFDESMDNCHSITSTAGWFYSMEHLETITHLDYLHTENVTDMQYMFAWCRALESESLDISHFNTANVTNMKYMFHDCQSLKSLDLSTFVTSKVTNMEQMFCHCSNLKSLDLSTFDTSKVTNMEQMFCDCPSLTSLNLSSFNTANVTNMKYMFGGCIALTSLNLSRFDTGKVTDMCGMFYNCSSLTSLNVSGFDTGKVTDMRYMFFECANLTSLNVSGFNTGSVTKMSAMFQNCSSLTSLDLSGFNTGSVTKMSVMFQNCSSLTSLDLSGFDTSKVTDMSGMFQNCSGLTSLNVRGFITRNVTDMAYMFRGCSSLTSLNLSGFTTRSVTDMTCMFYDCSSLASLNLSGINTGSVTNMSAMFQNCSSLTSLDVSGFDTGKVTDMVSMFKNCSGLKTIYCYDTWDPNTNSQNMFLGCTSLVGDDGTHYSADHVTAAYAHPNEGGYFTKKPLPYAVLSDDHTTLTFYYDKNKPADGMDIGPFESSDKRGWHDSSTTITTVEFDASMGSCSNITSTAFWFSGFSYLTTITGLDNLKTTNVEDMKYMFAECSQLNSLDLRTFDTRNVKNFEGFLYYCSGLQSIDLSSFDTRNALIMEKMFRDCHGLTSLDLRGFNTNKVGYMAEMFYSCFQLTTIFCNDYWNPSTGSKDMFSNCVKLKGGSGFSYSVGCTNARYANPYNNGYFTKKQIILGDVNDDGNVTPADAIMILYHYFGVNQNGFHRLAADVNGDGNITPADAIEALYIYFGAGSHNGARAAQPMTGSSRDPE